MGKRRVKHLVAKKITSPKSDALVGGVHDVVITVGTEATNVINVALQLKDENNVDLANIGVVHAYLSDSAVGDGVAAAAASGGVAIGTDGTVLIELTTDTIFILQSEADGDIDLDITEVGVDTWYLCVIIPSSGLLVVSDAITFA